MGHCFFIVLLYTERMASDMNCTFGEKRGFTIVETAVVLVIAGVLTAMVIYLLIPMMQAFRLTETREKIAKIEDAIAVYAIDNYRIPCPSLPSRAAANPPFGYEDGSGATGNQIPAAGCPNGSQGIVPFNTLGLPEDMVRDAWGNHFTYAVSQAFVQNTAAGNPATVHPQCRTREWMFDTGYGAGDMVNGTLTLTTRNISPQKARFCCSGYQPAGAADADLTVMYYDDYSATPLSAIQQLPADNPAPRNPGPDGFQRPDILMVPVDTLKTKTSGDDVLASDPTGGSDDPYYTLPQVPPPYARATAIAYIIVSHGPNGFGAYQPDNGGARLDAASAPGLEAENADNDQTFNDVTLRSDANNNQQFDDIVFWRTQDAIMTAKGESCVVP